MPPTLANGKICSVEIPATDVAGSVRFYEAVFGWSIRRRGNGQAADPTGNLIGLYQQPPADPK